jgi:RimJ/RimL family protein N-acetyltransferase
VAAFTPIETDRLTLRPFVDDDFEVLLDFQSQPDLTRFLPYEPWTREEAMSRMAGRMQDHAWTATGDTVSFAVVARATGVLIGDVNLVLLSEEHGIGEVGYVFRSDSHGFGYATEAVRELLRVGFECNGWHRILARIDPRNVASARVLDRLGMRREAHFVQSRWAKGEWTDEIVYALLSDEFVPAST